MLYSNRIQNRERRNTPILLRILGIHHKQEPIHRPNGLPIFQWFYCAEGKGEIIIDNKRSIVHPNQGFLIMPHASHSYRALTEDWKTHFVAFEGAVCPKMMSILNMSESGVYHFSQPKVFLTHLQSLFYITERKVPDKNRLLSKELYSLLLDLSELISKVNESAPAHANPTVSQIISYLEEHYPENLSLDDLSAELNRTPEYLCTIFKKHMGQTIISYLLSLRIIYARIFLLQYPEKKAQEIAAMCGFQSPSYFGKVFKQMMGETPTEFRNTNL